MPHEHPDGWSLPRVSATGNRIELHAGTHVDPVTFEVGHFVR